MVHRRRQGHAIYSSIDPEGWDCFTQPRRNLTAPRRLPSTTTVGAASSPLPTACTGMGVGTDAQARNDPIPNFGTISHTRHHARPSSSVRPETSCCSGECKVTTQPAWSTFQEQEPRRVAHSCELGSFQSERRPRPNAPSRRGGYFSLKPSIDCLPAAPHPTMATLRRPGVWPPPPRTRDLGGSGHGRYPV